MMSRASALVLPLILAAMMAGSSAQAETDNETRLREALRNATSQLRSLEDERTVLQAKLSVAEKERDALKAQVTTATRQLADSKKETAEQAGVAAGLEAQVAEQAATTDKVNGMLGQCRTSYQKATAAGQVLEETGKKLSADLAGQTARAERCEAANIELFKVGNEILDAYENKDLGDVLGNDEPFTGLKRVEMENLIQDYKDKLLDRKITQ